MKTWEWVSMIVMTVLIIIFIAVGISDSIAEQREWDRQHAVAHSYQELPMYYGGR